MTEFHLRDVDASYSTVWESQYYSINWVNFVNEKQILYKQVIAANPYAETVCPFHVYLQVCAWILQSVIQDNLSSAIRSKVPKPFRVPQLTLPHGVDAHTAKWMSFVACGRVPDSPFEFSHSNVFMEGQYADGDLTETNFPFLRNKAKAERELEQLFKEHRDLSQHLGLAKAGTVLFDRTWLQRKADYDAYLVQMVAYNTAKERLTTNGLPADQAELALASLKPVEVQNPGEYVMPQQGAEYLSSLILSNALVLPTKNSLIAVNRKDSVGDNLGFEESYLVFYNRFVHDYPAKGLVEYKTLTGARSFRTRSILYRNEYVASDGLRIHLFVTNKVDARDIETMVLHEPFIVSSDAFKTYQVVKPIYGLTVLRQGMIDYYANSKVAARETGAKLRRRTNGYQRAREPDDAENPPGSSSSMDVDSEPQVPTAPASSVYGATATTTTSTMPSFHQAEPPEGLQVKSGTKRSKPNTPPSSTKSTFLTLTSPTKPRVETRSTAKQAVGKDPKSEPKTQPKQKGKEKPAKQSEA